ncbi:MAG: NSS family neurotransmitter:Na+ symporter [Candidatus Azotimanducaceae bacterium]|jgi:NSS family neurotransmitter:Na+ symporter
MALGSESVHGMWSSRLMFVLAAAGSAVGLGNIWRFPYVAGENGGGAFVLVYLGCIFLIGVPIMTAEILLGRAGRQSPINAMRDLVSHSNASPLWQVIGWMGALAGFMILSFYAVIAGWAMSYLFQMGSGTFTGTDAVYAAAAFNELTGDVVSVVGWHTVFMLMTIGIAARGVGAGLEATVKILMPALFFLLIVLVIYSAVTSGRFVDGLSFLFSFNIEKLTWDGVLMAMGQAFFTLSLGMGAIMAYGAYIPKDVSIISTATTIALLDTSVALMSGLVIFPLVFANGLESSAGPGLMFVTLPLAFGQMTGGAFFGAIFFLLVTFAAITSSISLLEPAIAWLIERLKTTRVKAALIVGGVAWFIGLGSAFSFNIWSDVYFVNEMTFFDLMDYVSNNILLPLGGVFIALFAGWAIDQEVTRDQLSSSSPLMYNAWRFVTRFIAPAAVFSVFLLAFF